MKLLQVTMGHASITVTAHTYADLYDSDLDRVADAMDALQRVIRTGRRIFGGFSAASAPFVRTDQQPETCLDLRI
jgi:hypothetical protein